jgi:hypothetical protein
LQAVLGAVDDGNGRAPVPLAGDAPVAEAENDFAAAKILFLGEGRHFDDGFVGREAVERAGIDELAALVLVEGDGHFFFNHRFAFARLDYDAHGQAIFSAKLEVALVVGRHGHDSSGAVFHEHEVADPDGDFFTAEGVGGVASGEEADFFGGC